MRKKLKSISLILAWVFCLAGMSFGQSETGQISGTVVDANNAAVAGAAITAVSTKTGFTRTTTTNDEGYYIISNIQPSTYEITVASGNFQEFNKTFKSPALIRSAVMRSARRDTLSTKSFRNSRSASSPPDRRFI